MAGFRYIAALTLGLMASPVSGQGLADTCIVPPFDEGPAALQAVVNDLRVAVRDFPSLSRALSDAALEICLSDSLFLELGYLETAKHQIVLRADLPPGLLRAVLLHELRHLDQLNMGACPDPELSMRENARAVFANEADANAITLLVAWHLRAQGQDGIWQALTEWDSTADLAAVFAAAMRDTEDPAQAAAAAFAAWYASEERRERYYFSTCSAYLDRQDRLHSLPKYGEVGSGYFTTLCRMPDGATYPCAEPESAGRH